MKKLILPFSLMLLGFTGIATQASAQGYDRRDEVSRLAVEESRVYRGFPGGDRGNSRAAYDLDRLNREVRQVRVVIGNSRGIGPRIRDRFRRVVRATDFLNAQFRRGNMRGWEIRRRADQIRVELELVRRELRGRRIDTGGWR